MKANGNRGLGMGSESKYGLTDNTMKAIFLTTKLMAMED